MRIRTLAAVLVFIFVATTGMTCSQNVAETPGQKLYALKSDYKSLLFTMVAYKKQCEAKVEEIRLGCDDHVRKMQEIDKTTIWPAIQQAETSAELGMSTDLAVANSILAAAVAQLNAYIIDNAIGQRGTTLWDPALLSFS